MGIFKPINVVRGRDASGSDNVLSDPLNTGLDTPATLPTLMIVAALAHPLYVEICRIIIDVACGDA